MNRLIQLIVCYYIIIPSLWISSDVSLTFVMFCDTSVQIVRPYESLSYLLLNIPGANMETVKTGENQIRYSHDKYFTIILNPICLLFDYWTANMLTLLIADGMDNGYRPPRVLFQLKHPEGLQKGGVMGYVNLSYYIGKTPKMVLGRKKCFGPVQKPSKSGRWKILEPRNLDFFILS